MVVMILGMKMIQIVKMKLILTSMILGIKRRIGILTHIIKSVITS